MNGDPISEPEDYRILERYLEASLQALEGFVGIGQTFDTLSAYLKFHRHLELPAEFEELLIDLFFLKCRRDYRSDPEPPDRA